MNIFNRGGNIKSKRLVISLLLLSVVLLSASSVFAADSDSDVLAEVNDEIAIDNDVIAVAEDDSLNSNDEEAVASDVVEDDIVSEEPSNVVTNDTFYNYFDTSGTLLSNVTSDELIFEGDFTGVGVSYMIINQSIKLTGKNAVFDGVSFVVDADNVTVDGFTLTLTNDVSLFTLFGVDDVTLSNNNLNFNAFDGFDSYAIYAFAVTNLNIINNTITYVGSTDGTVVNNALRIEGDDDEDDPVPASDIVVAGNTFEILMPSVDVGYDPDTWAATVMNDGIVFYYCEDLEFVNNRVNLKYNNVASAYGYDSMYAVAVRSDAYTFGEIQSSGVVIANNTIDVDGYSCVYPVYVCADDFVVFGNNITSTSETYLAHGIDVEGPSAVGIVAKNNVLVESPVAAYGIYSYQYMGAVEDIKYYDNVVNVTAYASAAMEIVECNPEITGNVIYVYGNYTYGIVASIRDDGEISNNTVIVSGSNSGTDPTGDGLMPKNSMGISVKGTVLIEGNEVISTNIGINLVEKGEFTINDNFIGVKPNALISSYAIYADGLSNIGITNNTIYFIGNTDGTVVNNALRIEGDDDEDDPVPASNITVTGNTFEILMPSVDVGYDPDTWAATVMNDGIVFYYCEDLEFVNNRVNLKYNNVASAYGYDSIYAVSVRSDAYSFGEIQSSNVVIANNTIDVDGYSCVYPVYVCADDFVVFGNNITSTSETYLAHGIDVDGPSAVGIVAGNNILAKSPISAYGIYSYQYMGAVEDIKYYDNVVNVTAYASAAMEIVECNPEITGNVIYAYGNYTYGIIASIRDNGTLAGNTVSSFGSNNGTTPTGDSLMPKTSMGISVKGSSVIKDNMIGATGIAVNLVEEGGIVLTNNLIIATIVGKTSGYAIYASDISNLEITDNRVVFLGNTDGTFVNNAVRIEGDEDNEIPASNITVKNNTFNIDIPSVDVAYDPVTYEATVLSEGIVFYYCDNVEFTDNTVNLEYNNASGFYDTIYVVSVRGNPYNFEAENPIVCSDVVIKNNNITAYGHSYIYGILASAKDLAITNNTLFISSDAYYADGINVDGPANGNVTDNNVTVIAPGSAYGIYSAQYNGAVKDMVYDNNTIEVHAYAACAMELIEKNPIVSNNEIFAEGNYTYGIVASISGDAVIKGNDILCSGSEKGNVSTGDSILPLNSIGISVKGDVIIDSNSIVSSDIGINALEGDIAVSNNTVISQGDYAVVIDGAKGSIDNNTLIAKNTGRNAIKINTGIEISGLPYCKVIIFANELTKTYGTATQFTAVVLDEDGVAVVNKTVSLTVDNKVLFANTDAKGIAKFNINLNVGKYDALVEFNGDKVYCPKETTSLIVVKKAATALTAAKKTYKIKPKTKKYTVTLKANGKALAKVKVTLKVKGKTFKATTNAKGKATFKITNLNKKGKWTAKVKFAGNANYKASTKKVKITVKK